MDRERVLAKARQWIDSDRDVFNSPDISMTNFALEVLAERDAEIADDIIQLHQNHKNNELFLRELSYFVHELKGGNATAHAMFDEMQELLKTK